MAGRVIQFPKKDIVLECWECECQEFFLHLNEGSKTDIITAVECAECGFEIPFTNKAKGGREGAY